MASLKFSQHMVYEFIMIMLALFSEFSFSVSTFPSGLWSPQRERPGLILLYGSVLGITLGN